jgi:hypothetical protein
MLGVVGVQFICTGIVTEMRARTYYEAGASRSYLVREVLGGAGRLWPAAPDQEGA